MIQPITIERWQQAQEAERLQHTKTLEDGIHHYRIAYSHNFRYLGIDPDKKQIGICEVGPADFPALRYCNIGWACSIIEPMPSDYLQEFCSQSSIYLIKQRFEDVKTPENNQSEIWLFNVLQHTLDPEIVIYKAKQSKTIRYFEPIETEVNPYHPHSFSFQDFENWFPGVNQYYNSTENQCFHNGPCCYGVYHRK